MRGDMPYSGVITQHSDLVPSQRDEFTDHRHPAIVVRLDADPLAGGET
jgi:hypothetical protein